MGARQRLNSLHASSCLIAAALVGSIAESWTVFGLIAAVTLLMMLADSRIRLRPTSRPPNHRPPRERHHRRR